MSRIFKPQTYQDWLNELNFSAKVPEMVNAATNAAQAAMDKSAVRHDIALILATKYKKDIDRTAGNAMLVRAVEERYETVAQTLFKSRFSSLLNYVLKEEPNFDIQKKVENEGKTPLGFIKPVVTKADDGTVRLPLGFMKKPTRTDESGNTQPGLGFLDAD